MVNDYHIDIDCQQHWAEKMNREVSRMGGTISDVYLDYFFFLPSWYRRSYGTSWLDNLANLHYTGTAYLPIPKNNGQVELDLEYPEELVAETLKRGGKLIKTLADISRIPWCDATIQVTDQLKRLSDTRVHDFQVQTYIEGFVALTRAQVLSNSDSLSLARLQTVAAATSLASLASVPVTPTPSTNPQRKYYGMVKTRWTNPLRIREVNGGFVIVVPRIGARARSYVTFSKTWPFGAAPAFGKFILRKLKSEKRKWRSAMDVISWVDKHKKQRASTSWKQKVMESWMETSTQKTHNSAIVSSPMVLSPMVNKGIRSKHSIRLPDFVELRSKSSRTGQVQCVRIMKRAESAKHPAQCLLYFPAVLVGNKKGAEYTLGVKYGTNSAWINFVSEYVEYALSKWQNYAEARDWLANQRKTFIKHVQALWQFRGGNDVPVDRFWRIGPSTLPVDQEYIDKGYFKTKSTRTDKGYGLFCRKPGKYLIVYEGPTTCQKSTPPTDLESEYMAGILESDDIMVPTPEALETWALHHSFLVGHKRLELDPTHEPCCVKDSSGKYRPCLQPRRVAKKNEEFCFDYGKHLEGAKDVATTEELSSMNK